eukprot:11247119-Ditylum_brightwellii.AAC.1
MHLIHHSDFQQHGMLVADLHKAWDLDRKKWPSTQTSAFKLLVKCTNLHNAHTNNTFEWSIGGHGTGGRGWFRNGTHFLQNKGQTNTISGTN